MKLQLDTENKKIKLESTVKLKDLVKTLNSLFPNKEWKDYDLETNTTIVGWTNPIIINPPYYQPYWERPWVVTTMGLSKVNALMADMPKGTMLSSLSSQSGDYKIKSGIYNVDIKV